MKLKTKIIILITTTLIASTFLVIINIKPTEYTRIVETSSGKIRGIKEDNFEVFKGIPYAEAPIGDFRWKPPRKIKYNNDLIIAENFGNNCPQYIPEDGSDDQTRYIKFLLEGLGFSKIFSNIAIATTKFMPKPTMSEDCLYLNIRKKSIIKDKQPVMVWFHGGAKHFGSGSDPSYQSNALVENNVILITVNFRLGILGYYANPELSKESENNSSGNYGLLDQIEALKWIKENIHNFGGDPDNITVFGQSAGGEVVVELMSSPLAKGLFNKGIIQSGMITSQLLNRSNLYVSKKEAESNGLKFMNKLGAKNISELRNMDINELINQTYKAENSHSYSYPYLQTVIDGWVLKHETIDGLISGEIQGVPLIAGFNKDEGSLLYPMEIKKAPSFLVNTEIENYDNYISDIKNTYTEGSQLLDLYNLNNKLEREKNTISLFGDERYGAQMRLLSQINNENTYLYYFTRTPPRKNQTLGAYHMAEVPLIFGTNDFIFKANDEDLNMAKKMRKYWTNFAKTGDPNSSELEKWDMYNIENDSWLNINHDINFEKVSIKEKLDILQDSLMKKYSGI